MVVADAPDGGGGDGGDQQQPEEEESADTGGTTAPVGGETGGSSRGGGNRNGGGNDAPSTGGQTSPPGGQRRPDQADSGRGGDPGSGERTGTGIGSSPPGGQDPPDGYEPDTGGQTSPPGGRSKPEPDPLDPTLGDTSPPGGQPGPDGGGKGTPTRPDADDTTVVRDPAPDFSQTGPQDGPAGEAADDLRSEVASQSDRIDPSEVAVERDGGQLRAYVPDSVIKQDLRREAASQSDQFGPEDVTIEETDEGYQASLPGTLSSAEAAELRSDIASENPAIFPTDVELEYTDDGNVEATISEAGQERAAEHDIAQEFDVDPLEIDAEKQDQSTTSPPGGVEPPEGESRARDDDTGFKANPLTDEASVSIAAEKTQYDENELAVEDGDVIVDQEDEQRAEPMPPAEPIDAPVADEQPGDARGQTTRTDIGPDGPSQPGALEAAAGGARSFFTDPYGSTIGYGVEDLGGSIAEEVDDAETEVSERAGFDVGRTATVTGETLVDRPVDSFVTGVATIRTGGAAAASDVGGDTAAAGALATGTGTGTATGVASGIGATTAAGVLPVGAAVFGARGLQEEDVSLPTEAAPQPGEDVDEVEPTRGQYPDEVEPSGGTIADQSEIDVSGETSAGASTTRVPVGETGFDQPEIEVGEDTAGPVENELPVGGDGATEDAPSERSGGGVTPDDYPVAGRDFPADPTREYVPGQRPDVGVEAAELTGGLLEQEEAEEDEDELGPPDDPFIESDRRLYDPSRTFGEQRSFREVDPTSGELGESAEDIGGGIAGTGAGIEPARGETVEENFARYMQERREQAQRSEVLAGSSFRFPGDTVEGTGTGERNLLEEAQQTRVAEDAAGQFDTPMEFLGAGEEERTAGDTRPMPEQDQPGQLDSPAEQVMSGEAMADPLEQSEEFAQQTEAAFGNEVAQEYEFPSEYQFGYGGPQESTSRRRRRPPLFPLPDLPGGGDEPLAEDDGDAFDQFWERPVASPEDIFGP